MNGQSKLGHASSLMAASAQVGATRGLASGGSRRDGEVAGPGCVVRVRRGGVAHGHDGMNEARVFEARADHRMERA